MIGVVASPSRRSRWFAVGVALGVVVPAAALAVLSASGSPRSSAALEDDRRAFARYEEAVQRAVRDGGFVVVQGMRPGLTDIAEGSYPDETLVTMAQGWKGSMDRVRAEFASVEPPTFLEEAARLYEVALAAYADVGDALLAAAEARGDERAALVDRAPPLGERADELWERARSELDRHRTRLGLDPEGP